ncbi:MAG: hypothetical protein EF807_05690 [Candidatus Methanolliviera hydrocarbonicum]|uniref:Radical SAM protein n=1 Tax=Candidatus Methanolliviera hydrocarbonicum TaxID=2491085 RepID=A0A520KW06_9EURY|nr:MAG: hypothetical protein EF807_05690 [Candidatus Methanolliviera hydrocarbonicum]
MGCNFKCDGCISKILVDQVDSASGILKRRRSEDIIKEAIAENCIGIAFFINEPTVSYYTFKDLAKRAKDNGLSVGCSTNAYFTEKALRARYISSISKDIPFQVMRFIPFGEASIDLEPTIKESEMLCNELRNYLNYVYLFNSPGTEYLMWI